MRKIFIFFVVTLSLLLTSCSNKDDVYIETTKGIVLSKKVLNSGTIEDLANQMLNKATNSKIAKEKIKWEVQGNTSDGKMIIASYDKNIVYIPVVDNGDYIQVSPIEIHVITKENEKMDIQDMIFSNVWK